MKKSFMENIFFCAAIFDGIRNAFLAFHSFKCSDNTFIPIRFAIRLVKLNVDQFNRINFCLVIKTSL